MNYIEEITALEDLVGEKLADESEITPAEIRQCFSAMTAFLRKISPLASGTYNVGNVTENNIRTINLPYDVGTADYYVKGSKVSKGANYDKDNDVIDTIKDKTSTSFKLCLKDVTSNTQNIDFEWAIYPKNL